MSNESTSPKPPGGQFLLYQTEDLLTPARGVRGNEETR